MCHTQNLGTQTSQKHHRDQANHARLNTNCQLNLQTLQNLIRLFEHGGWKNLVVSDTFFYTVAHIINVRSWKKVIISLLQTENFIKIYSAFFAYQRNRQGDSEKAVIKQQSCPRSCTVQHARCCFFSHVASQNEL